MKQFNISHAYDIDLWQAGVYDAKSDLLSQICAFLNPLRMKAQTALGMEKELKLSPSYVLFYCVINRCRKFLGGTAQSADGIFTDLFTFDEFRDIVSAHGLVPLSAMPDAACHHKGAPLYVAENRLRLGRKQLAERTADKDEILADIYAVLCEGLGEPPQQFTFSFIDKNGEISEIKDITPKEFYNAYCKTDLSEYGVFSTDERAVKQAVSDMLLGGEQVVICADTRHQANQFLGILDTEVIDEADVFGKEYGVSKTDKQSCGIIKPCAYLTLDGVSFDENGAPLRFKAQDAHGSDTGADGHYTMSAKWFDEYALFAVVKNNLTR